MWFFYRAQFVLENGADLIFLNLFDANENYAGIPETLEVMDYCAKHKIYPQIQMIKAA